MVYVFAAVSLLIMLALFLMFNHKKLKEKQLFKFRENWGKANSENIELAKLGWYNPLPRLSEYHKLTAQTLSDIDFFQLFAHINHTNSKIGEQFLFHKLQHPTDDLEQLTDLDR